MASFFSSDVQDYDQSLGSGFIDGIVTSCDKIIGGKVYSLDGCAIRRMSKRRAKIARRNVIAFQKHQRLMRVMKIAVMASTVWHGGAARRFNPFAV